MALLLLSMVVRIMPLVAFRMVVLILPLLTGHTPRQIIDVVTMIQMSKINTTKSLASNSSSLNTSVCLSLSHSNSTTCVIFDCRLCLQICLFLVCKCLLHF